MTPITAVREYRPSVDAPENIVALVSQYTDWDTDIILRIIKRESNYHCDSYNPNPWYGANNATGAMQILLPLHQRFFEGDPFDCAENIAAGHRMWVEQGYAPWAPVPW